MKEVGLLYNNYPIAIFNDNEGKYYLGEWEHDYFGHSHPKLMLDEKTENYSLEQIRKKTGLDLQERHGRHIIYSKPLKPSPQGNLIFEEGKNES